MFQLLFVYFKYKYLLHMWLRVQYFILWIEVMQCFDKTSTIQNNKTVIVSNEWTELPIIIIIIIDGAPRIFLNEERINAEYLLPFTFFHIDLLLLWLPFIVYSGIRIIWNLLLETFPEHKSQFYIDGNVNNISMNLCPMPMGSGLSIKH